jgi:hypothetical protein
MSTESASRAVEWARSPAPNSTRTRGVDGEHDLQHAPLARGDVGDDVAAILHGSMVPPAVVAPAVAATSGRPQAVSSPRSIAAQAGIIVHSPRDQARPGEGPSAVSKRRRRRPSLRWPPGSLASGTTAALAGDRPKGP